MASRATMRVWIGLMATVGLLTAAAVNASDMAFFHGMWKERWYNEKQVDDIDRIEAETQGLFNSYARFDDDSVDDLENWTKAQLTDGELDIIWLNGSMPRVLYTPGGQGDSLAEQWLDSGNMFINVSYAFGFQSFECDGGCDENGPGGPSDILDLEGDVFVDLPGQIKIGSNTGFTRTPEGEQYIPFMAARTVTSHAMALAQIKGDWSVAGVFSSNTGTVADADYGDPAVIYNRVTGGYLAIISQAGYDLWNNRGKFTAQFISNWVTQNAVGYSVDPQGKLTTTWSAVKNHAW